MIDGTMNVSEAVVALQPNFQRMAHKLAAGDLFLKDDLVQEMSIAVLTSERPQPRSYFIRRAYSRAVSALRSESVHRRFDTLENLKREPAAKAQNLVLPERIQQFLEIGEYAKIPA